MRPSPARSSSRSLSPSAEARARRAPGRRRVPAARNRERVGRCRPSPWRARATGRFISSTRPSPAAPSAASRRSRSAPPAPPGRRCRRSRDGRPGSPASWRCRAARSRLSSARSRPSLVSSVWGITSSDGGATWSAPANVRGGGPNEALAYGSDITAAMTGTSPVLSLPQAGNLVVQTGLGSGSPSVVVTNSTDGSTTDADLAVDAATGEVVASWPSVAHNPSALRAGRRADRGSALQLVPGQSRNALVLAGRDTGPGVFGAYTTDGTHVRLLRYGGGTVAVGSRSHTAAKVLGVATGIAGPHLGDVGRRLGRRRRSHPLEQGRDALRADPAPQPERGQPLPDPGRRPPRPARPARRRDPERHRSRAARGDLPRARAAPPLGHGVVARR